MVSLPDLADPERRLALVYAPADRRAALALLWALDERLASIVRGSREAMLGEIRLAWWNEALAALDAGPPGGEPLLEKLAEAVSAHRLPLALLAALTEGWSALLEPMPLSRDALVRHGERRGAALFALAAAVLGCDPGNVEEAGAGWALVDLGFHVSDPVTAIEARKLAVERLHQIDTRRWPKPLRALAVLTALARRDCVSSGPRRQGSPVRLARSLWAGLSGR